VAEKLVRGRTRWDDGTSIEKLRIGKNKHIVHDETVWAHVYFMEKVWG
jgi:hypothetical protein